ncbi:MAG: T9SS type A sorting domain-containing protein [Bacteroidetes bacterium]|nr:T9SS type A sorting domain-containing protein [Bacteroidota bacterium]
MRSNVLPFKLLFGVITILFVIFSKNVQAQLANFDSVKTVVSSADYDYKNPSFESSGQDLSQFTWLAYERYNGSLSDIVIRQLSFAGYSPEVVITNSTGEQNINPVVNGKFLSWQSNKNGNWDLFYSIYNGSNWSAPSTISSTSADEINPYIINNNTGPIQYSAYYLLFERAGDIFLRRYKLQSLSWDSLEINLTDSISQNCSKPRPAGFSECMVYFSKEVSPGVFKPASRKFRDYTSYVQLFPPAEYDFILRDKNYNISYGIGSYFTFSSGSPVSNVVGLIQSNYITIDTLSKRIPGSHTNGKGSLMGIVTDAAGSYYFSALGFVTRNNDSTYISLMPHYFSGYTNIVLKKKYLGNDSVKTMLDLSIPVSQGNFYKICAVWEQKINGKSALVESYMSDVIGAVANTGSSTKYELIQNYPNPFNPSTVIRYQLSVAGNVSLKVFDLLGKEVASLVNEKQIAGSYAVDFNSAEFNLPSGIYFYTLSAGEFKETRKMVLIK